MNFHYTFGTLPSDLQRLAAEPASAQFDLVGIQESDRQRVERFARGFASRLAGNLLKDAASTAQCSPPELLRVFERWATVQEDGTIAGWPSVLLHARVKSYERVAPEAELASKGASGLFKQLLKTKEGIEDCLIEAVESRRGSDGRRLSKKQRREVYNAFLLECMARGITEYPVHAGQSKAKRSVYRYIDAYLDCHPELFDIWFGENKKKQLMVGTGMAGFKLCTRPFDRVLIDAHRVDVVGIITINTPHGPKKIAISRIWLVVVYDEFSNAALGYSLSFEEQVSAETVEKAIIMSQTPWQQRELVKGLRYAHGAALPAGNVENLASCPISMLSMDNFSSHYSHLIQSACRQALGMHTMYGGVGAWWQNAPLERFFGVLEQRGIHKVSSSTGTGTTDPMRPSNPAKRAIDDNVTWEYVVDLLEVLITELNTEKKSGRSGMTPLEILRNHYDPEMLYMVPNLDIPFLPGTFRIGYDISQRPVRGGRSEKSVVRPYFEIYGRRYTNEKLNWRFDLVDSEITVHIRREDMSMEAYLPDGSPLGAMSRIGGDDATSISLGELGMLYNGKNDVDLPNEDLINARREVLEKQASADAENRPNRISKAGTELAQSQLLAKNREQKRQNEEAAKAASQGQPTTRSQRAAPKGSSLSLDDILEFGNVERRA